MEVTTRKTTNREAKELYKELIQNNIDALRERKVMTLGNIIS